MRKEIWDSMLDADMNARYWSKLGRQYYMLDLSHKTFLAIMASGTVAGWGFWSEYPTLWKALSALAAVTGIALPIINWPKTMQRITDVRQKWLQIKFDYEVLWLEFRRNKDTELVAKVFKNVKDKELKASQDETNLPHRQKLLLKCREEVVRSRGLNS